MARPVHVSIFRLDGDPGRPAGLIGAHRPAPRRQGVEEVPHLVHVELGPGSLMGATGAVYPYGDATYEGSIYGHTLNAPIVTAAGI